ncbi:hypothetical protein JFY59_05295 [Porphyromonas gingivalis]|uniref:hypothetical protein n=1 Tax=Porphyromonas gingivalis TaxID=837 RepID=UPI001F1C2E92|nr:hypothetical protein [Porphyromonas gingivalis]MCE8189602.1 hypothetical protein [Porphyromonas gingivalis]
MKQNDGTTRKIIRRRGFVQGRHVSESIQESPECISNQVDMLIDWQRIRALLSIHLAAIHLLIGLSLRYKE